MRRKIRRESAGNSGAFATFSFRSTNMNCSPACSESSDISIEHDEEKPESVEEWATEHFEEWLKENGFEEEAQFFKDEEITGKSLMVIEKSDLKEMGIKSLGRRLELMKSIKEIQKQRNTSEGSGDTDGSASASVGQPIWLKKVTKEKKKEWCKDPKAKNMYLEKIAFINQASGKLWRGNNTIHFKNNEDNKLKLEELTSNLETSCSVPEIGFGREAIRNHILQWVHERNRRISDGYDFEAHHKPAKRARFSSPSSTSGTSSTETEEDLDASPSNSDEPSNNMEDINLYSARIMIMVAFGVNSLQMLTVKHHLLPLAKLLTVKVRALGKYQMIIPLAKALLRQSFVTISDEETNYKHLRRETLVIERTVDTILKDAENMKGGDDAAHA